jgi:hypothetical protein
LSTTHAAPQPAGTIQAHRHQAINVPLHAPGPASGISLPIFRPGGYFSVMAAGGETAAKWR